MSHSLKDVYILFGLEIFGEHDLYSLDNQIDERIVEMLKAVQQKSKTAKEGRRTNQANFGGWVHHFSHQAEPQTKGKKADPIVNQLEAFIAAWLSRSIFEGLPYDKVRDCLFPMATRMASSASLALIKVWGYVAPEMSPQEASWAYTLSKWALYLWPPTALFAHVNGSRQGKYTATFHKYWMTSLGKIGIFSLQQIGMLDFSHCSSVTLALRKSNVVMPARMRGPNKRNGKKSFEVWNASVVSRLLSVGRLHILNGVNNHAPDPGQKREMKGVAMLGRSVPLRRAIPPPCGRSRTHISAMLDLVMRTPTAQTMVDTYSISAATCEGARDVGILTIQGGVMPNLSETVVGPQLLTGENVSVFLCGTGGDEAESTPVGLTASVAVHGYWVRRRHAPLLATIIENHGDIADSIVYNRNPTLIAQDLAGICDLSKGMSEIDLQVIDDVDIDDWAVLVEDYT
ncbi:hypothetical protein HHK36_017077 [Tetracentron sinense]|uniref:Aminotransferase-like plant mobile domain-containing protein n=1 Tax=Tetracentron sinense TaxID=13715 RepID=A0A834Z6H7_TETSI|nr:hypothetical protein HHK36_017077 [Tetracentron sinense]